MNTIDFTELGGYPLCQDDIDYLQQAYIACMEALAAAPVVGTTPYALTGMAVSGGGNTVADGWFVYGGELIQFTGGTVVPGGGEVALVVISTASSPLTFNDSSTPSVIKSKTATLSHGATVTDATHFPVSALLPFAVSLGQAGRESAWSSLAVSTASGVGGVTGTIYYKKNFITNTVHLRGFLTANNAQNFAGMPNTLFYTMATLPAGYVPNNNAFFTSYYFVSGGIKDNLDVGWIKMFHSSVDTAGDILINWIQPDVAISSYAVEFNAILPLD